MQEEKGPEGAPQSPFTGQLKSGTFGGPADHFFNTVINGLTPKKPLMFDFGQAMNHLRAGNKISRWSTRHCYITYLPSSIVQTADDNGNVKTQAVQHMLLGHYPNMVPTPMALDTNDIMAADWFLVH